MPSCSAAEQAAAGADLVVGPGQRRGERLGRRPRARRDGRLAAGEEAAEERHRTGAAGRVEVDQQVGAGEHVIHDRRRQARRRPAAGIAREGPREVAAVGLGARGHRRATRGAAARARGLSRRAAGVGRMGERVRDRQRADRAAQLAAAQLRHDPPHRQDALGLVAVHAAEQRDDRRAGAEPFDGEEVISPAAPARRPRPRRGRRAAAPRRRRRSGRGGRRRRAPRRSAPTRRGRPRAAR